MTAEQIGTALGEIQARWRTAGSTQEDLQILESCLVSARNIGEKSLSARILFLLSSHFLQVQQRLEAMLKAKEGLALVRQSQTELEVDLLIMLARLTLANNVAEAAKLSSEAFHLSSALHGHAKPHVALRYAEALGASGQLDEAIRLMRQAERDYELDNDLVGRSHVLQRLCVQLINAGHFDAAIEYASEAIRVGAELQNLLVRINALKFLAISLTKVGRLAEAYEVARKAIDLASTVPKSHLNADCFGVLGDIYLELQDLSAALSLFSRAYQQYSLNGFRNGEAIALARIAETYARAGDLEQADQLFHQAEKRALEVNNPIIHRSAVIVHAAMYVRQGRTEEADRLLNTVDSSLRTIESVIPPDATIKHALDTFRTISSSTPTVMLPAFDALMSTAPSTLPRGNPAPPTIPNPTPPTGVHVTMFGAFRVVRQGREITMDEWKRKKARDVFKLLAANHRRSVSTDEIVLQLWGEDTPVESCLPTLQNAISAIRVALEPDLKPRNSSMYLTFRDGSYLLDLGADGTTDLEVFKGLVGTAYATENLTTRRQLLNEATTVYQGVFLPDDKFEPWTEFLRDTLRDTCAEAFDDLAAVCFQLGDEAAAKEAMRRAAELEE